MHANLPSFDDRWDYGDPEGTRSVFTQLLSTHDDAPSAWRLELLTQLARTHSLQRQFAEAHAVLDQVDAELGGAPPARLQVRTWLERGRTHNSAGQKAEARTLFERAFELAGQAGLEALAVDAAHMVAIAAPDEAMLWNERALELADASDDPGARRWRGSLLNNVGWTHFEAGRHERALECFEQALTCRLEAGKAGPVRTARWCVAKAMRVLGRADEALAIQRELAAEHEANDNEDGYVEEELGECLLALDRTDDAHPHFKRAFELLGQDPWLVENEAERLARLSRLGGTEGG